MGKSIELAKIVQKRKVNIACVQETRWAGSKARNVVGYKLWYSGVVKGKNGVGILVDRDLRESVVEVRRVNDRLMFIKLVIGERTLNVVSAYAPQEGLDEEVKRRFWEGLDDIVRSIPPTERLFIGGDFNGHIGSAAGSYGEVHGSFGLGDRNGGGNSPLDFAKSFDLRVVQGLQSYPGRDPRDSAQVLSDGYRHYDEEEEEELEGRLSAMGAWRSSGDASTMWSTTANYMRQVAKEVLGISQGFSGRHQGGWWWNDVVQGKVEAKKVAYGKLAGSTSEEERR
ncbi:PREDICTED: craniofacial development protein 2-like [Nicotiana attenuata]|uniref:craniofacial development protein 2-like n=1 Tax=Nicotiana attenuata TaxID=49451 RepID=UPI000905BECE|nr:PREDICTED: craniofacial development protein 2-like [Nicotiana attenuata]